MGITQPEIENPFRFEPYFLRWDSCLLFLDPEKKMDHAHRMLYGHSGGTGTIPVWRHRTCEATVRVTDKAPPRMCPHCQVDTVQEQAEREIQGLSTGKPEEAYDGLSAA